MGATVYFSDHQELFCELHPEISKSGAARQAFDMWLKQAQDIDPDDLQEAMETAMQETGANSIEQLTNDFAGEIYSAEGFIEAVGNLDSQEIENNE